MTPVESATSPLLRQLNARTVLELLRGSGPVTGTEIMASTGLSRPTVHTVCDHLIERGWVSELESRRPEGPGRPGRPARCYQFNTLAGYVVGVDVGEHRIRAVLADLRGEPLHTDEVRLPSGAIAADQRIELIRTVIDDLVRKANVEATAVLAVGLGVPAPVDPSGHIFAPEHYLPGMASLDIAATLAAGRPWPVLLENDANLAAVAESWQGGAAGEDNLVVVLAGERLGAGFILDGRLVRGNTGSAGELGFLELVTDVGNTHGIARLAREWVTQAAEQAANGTAADAASEDHDGILVRTYRDAGVVEATALFAAARDGDPLAQEVLTRIADRMARTIGVLATMLNPATVVIGGGVVDSLDLLEAALQERLARYTHHPPMVVSSTLGERGVLVGATRMALDHAEALALASLGR